MEEVRAQVNGEVLHIESLRDARSLPVSLEVTTEAGAWLIPIAKLEVVIPESAILPPLALDMTEEIARKASSCPERWRVIAVSYGDSEPGAYVLVAEPDAARAEAAMRDYWDGAADYPEYPELAPSVVDWSHRVTGLRVMQMHPA